MPASAHFLGTRDACLVYDSEYRVAQRQDSNVSFDVESCVHRTQLVQNLTKDSQLGELVAQPSGQGLARGTPIYHLVVCEFMNYILVYLVSNSCFRISCSLPSLLWMGFYRYARDRDAGGYPYSTVQ